MIATPLAQRWEARLRKEGLGMDQLEVQLRGRVIIKRQVITSAPMLVPDPTRLARALEAYLQGDDSHFTDRALALLASRSRRVRRPGWPRRRATILLRICWAIADGKSVHEAANAVCRRIHADDLARKYLPLLAAGLSEERTRDDDADGE